MTERKELGYRKLLHAVNEDKRLDPFAFRLYCWYLRRADFDGECWEADPEIAGQLGMSVPTLRKARKRLVGFGYIKARLRSGKPCLVTMTRLDEAFFQQAALTLGPVQLRSDRSRQPRNERSRLEGKVETRDRTPSDRTLWDRGQDENRDLRGFASPISGFDKGDPEGDGGEERDAETCVLWERVKAQAQIRITRQNYDQWLRPTYGLRRDGDAIVVSAPNDLAIDWLTTRMRKVMERVIASVAPGTNVVYLPRPQALGNMKEL